MVAVATLTLLVAACGSSPKSPGVAGEGKSPPTTAAVSAGSSGGVAKDFMQKLLSYAECMRANGISDFPDPTAGPGGQGGGFNIKAGQGSDLDPDNSTYEAANQACQSRLPNGGVQPAPTAAQLAALTKIASCMRSYGFPSFSDPNDKGTFVLNGIDAGSEQFQSAMQTCQTEVKYNGPMSINSVSRAPAH